MPKSRCSNVTAFLLEKVSEGKGERVKGEGSYQLVGWVERSETQQVSELLGERVKEL